MDIQEEVLNKLRCDVCSEYLSCCPVMISSIGKNICGRCDIPEDTSELFIKNQVYEDLASVILFPCKNKRYGCQERDKMTTVVLHEDFCQFKQDKTIESWNRKYNCPSLVNNKKCRWRGNYGKIAQHYMKSHPDFIVDSDEFDKPDLSRDSVKNVMFTAFDYSFLLQSKCSVASGSLYHDVIFLGDPELAGFFSYKISLNRGKACISEIKKVKPIENNFILNEIGSAKTKFTSFQLLGDYKEIYITISLQSKELECERCQGIIDIELLPRAIETGRYYCILCVSDFMDSSSSSAEDEMQHSHWLNEIMSEPSTSWPNVEQPGPSTQSRESVDNEQQSASSSSAADSDSLELCRYYTNGCMYENIPALLIKHENWLCQFGNLNCADCSGVRIKNKNIMNHMKNKHCVYQKAIHNGADAVVQFSIEDNLRHYITSRAHGFTFNYVVHYDTDSFKIDLVSDTDLNIKGLVSVVCRVQSPSILETSLLQSPSINYEFGDEIHVGNHWPVTTLQVQLVFKK